MSLYFLWGLINALQMIIYNPLAQIKFPLNVMMLYGVLHPITSLDLIPPELSTDVIFSMSSEEKGYSDILENLGYDSHNFIYNLGTLFYYICLLVFGIILLGFSYVVKQMLRKCRGNIGQSTWSSMSGCKQRCTHRFKIRRRSSYNLVMLNTLFLVFFEGYIEILLSCFLNS